MSIIDDIISLPLPSGCYVNQVFEKKHIVLHHTAGNGSPYSVASYWKGNANKVSTPFLIARGKNTKAGQAYTDGQIFQCFGSNKGCWHLGLRQKDLDRGKPGNKSSVYLNMNSIGIETCNYGGLTLKGNKFITYDGTVISANDVYEFDKPYRGFKYYQKYTEPQMENLMQLIRYLCEKYEIECKFPGIEIFDICPDALRGNLPIFSHTSVRPADEKQDMAPQKILLDMLFSL